MRLHKDFNYDIDQYKKKAIKKLGKKKEKWTAVVHCSPCIPQDQRSYTTS